jgi:hypothetical protein
MLYLLFFIIIFYREPSRSPVHNESSLHISVDDVDGGGKGPIFSANLKACVRKVSTKSLLLLFKINLFVSNVCV